MKSSCTEPGVECRRRNPRSGCGGSCGPAGRSRHRPRCRPQPRAGEVADPKLNGLDAIDGLVSDNGCALRCDHVLNSAAADAGALNAIDVAFISDQTWSWYRTSTCSPVVSIDLIRGTCSGRRCRTRGSSRSFRSPGRRCRSGCTSSAGEQRLRDEIPGRGPLLELKFEAG